MKNIIHFYITDHCSTHCPFCLMGSGPFGERYLSKEKTNALINCLSSDSLPNVVRLLGGEPLTHPNFADILTKLLDDSRISEVEIITNGIGIEEKMPFIFEMVEKFKKQITVRFSINYWLLLVNPLYEKDKMKNFLKEYQKSNLKFSVNIGVRDLPQDREMLTEWQSVFGSSGNRVIIAHLAAYTDEIKRACPGLYKKRIMICPHLDAEEKFVGPDGKIFENCNDLLADMQFHSKYHEK